MYRIKIAKPYGMDMHLYEVRSRINKAVCFKDFDLEN